MTLNYQLYNQIRNKVHHKTERHKKKLWDNYSYELFKSQELNTKGDFWKLVAFAYTWMPTIPNIYMEKIEDEEQLLFELKQLQKGNGDIEWLFRTLTPVINNSVVGTSKVLHFVAPDEVPIYDSRVIDAWSTLFKKDKQLRLQYRPNGDIGKVLFYVEKMKQWLADCRKEQKELTLRDIEIVLYYYGENKAKKKVAK